MSASASTRSLRFVLACGAVFVGFNILAFRAGTYERFLAPDSTTSAFDAGLTRVDRAASEPKRDVLVLGDSRIFSGFDADTADASARGLRFINAGIPGTTPRCWYVFDRRLDPQAARFRAIVIPLDTYDDDDSAIGSIDGDDRSADLAYIALRTTIPDAFTVAASFPTSNGKADALAALVLRGPLLRADIQNFAADPARRFHDLENVSAPAPAMRPGDLRGLRVDFARDTLVAPLGYAPAGLDELRRQVLAVGKRSDAYYRYRMHWLAPIVARYAALHVPIVFVRIPTRPLHRFESHAIGSFLAREGSADVTVLDQTPYVRLERPELFVDADHLNDRGARIFSTMLARDVAAALANAQGSTPVRPPSDARAADVAEAAPAIPLWHALEIGAPLRFQSSAFVIFFAIVAALYFATPIRSVRRAIVLVASWYFYARWNAWYLLVLLGLTATDYVFGRLIERARDARRRLLAGGIAANLLFLGTAKYADFLTGSIARALGFPTDPWALHVLVPIGISFHTFQSISYLVDVYRGRTKAVRNPLDYALYLAFFPQLLAGPIVRAGTFFGEFFAARALRALRSGDLAAGGTQFVVGLAKKCVVADRFAVLSDGYFSNPLAAAGAAAAWSAALAFALQIYFDFSGYSDIAIGLARILGFRFPQNFRRPYLAASPQEFWRRWHITLSFWLRDYVYIPLGGNRHGARATQRNLVVTMLLGGLWHGANWTFVAWGGYHGALLVAQNALRLPGVPRSPIARIPAIAITFVLILVGWVLFRAPSFGVAFHVFAAMLSPGASASVVGLWLLAFALALVALEVVAEVRPQTLARLPTIVRAGALIGVALVLELGSNVGDSPPFIYFRF
jgi:alginate O-acetyltransferase complex protein AlgI